MVDRKQCWVQDNFFEQVKTSDSELDPFAKGFLNRSLRQVIEVDYFRTHFALRKIYVPNYSLDESKGIIETCYWLIKDEKNIKLYNDSGLDICGLNRFPKYVMENQASISLWFELNNSLPKEVSVEEDFPVAFSHRSEAFKKDLKSLTFTKWVKLSTYPFELVKVDLDTVSESRTLRLINLLYAGNSNEHRLEAIDVLSEQLFREYWKNLLRRQKFLSSLPCN